MPLDDYDKRLRDIENKVYAFETTFSRIADDIHEMRTSMQEFIEVKGKLEAIDVLFKKLDTLKDMFQALNVKLAPIFNEHTICTAKQHTLEARVQALEVLSSNTEVLKTGAITFLTGRTATVIDWCLKIGLGLLLVAAFKKGVV